MQLSFPRNFADDIILYIYSVWIFVCLHMEILYVLFLDTGLEFSFYTTILTLPFCKCGGSWYYKKDYKIYYVSFLFDKMWFTVFEGREKWFQR